MERLAGDPLFSFFDMLLACDQYAPVRTEINRRLQGRKKAQRDPLLLFYLAVIRYQEGQDYDSRRFMEVLDAADAADLARLRAAAARLASYAHGPLQQALQQFRFDVLDWPVPLFGGGLPPLPPRPPRRRRRIVRGGFRGATRRRVRALGDARAARWRYSGRTKRVGRLH